MQKYKSRQYIAKIVHNITNKGVPVIIHNRYGKIMTDESLRPSVRKQMPYLIWTLLLLYNII